MNLLLCSFVIAFLLLCYIAYSCFKANGCKHQRQVKAMIVLGSGGHTSEMISLIRNLDPSRFSPVVFVHAESDVKSPRYLADVKLDFLYSIRTIPRSREVGQSYVSSVYTTLIALFKGIKLLLDESPDVLITNGPGTCVPLALCVAIFRVFNVMACRIVYVESFCRVQELSMSGKILYPIADDFVVQWETLKEKYPKADYLGILL